MRTIRTLTTAITTAALGVSLQVAGMATAFADAGPHASCIGLESSSIAPAGTSEEFPGGRAELQRLVLELAPQFGVTPGAIISPVAHLHAGSHAACDEAAE